MIVLFSVGVLLLITEHTDVLIKYSIKKHKNAQNWMKNEEQEQVEEASPTTSYYYT